MFSKKSETTEMSSKLYIFQYRAAPVPAGVASHGVPPLVLVDVHTLHICLSVNVICAAGQSLEETSPVAPSVNPGSVVIANPPHYANTVTLHHTKVTSDLPPEPERRRKYFMRATIFILPSELKHYTPVALFSHLVTRCGVRHGLQTWKWLTHKDVAFTSDRPDGLFGRGTLNTPGVTARHTQ